MKNNRTKLKKIKICFLINCFSLGGAQTFLYNLIKNLDKKHFTVTVISIKKEGPLYKKFKKMPITVHSLNVNSKMDFLSIFRLYKLLKIISPDILHTHLFYAHLMGRLVSICFEFKTINTIHNTLHYGKIKKFLIKITDFLTDLNIVICHKIKNIMIDEKISRNDKIIVISNGVDLKQFQTKLLKKEKEQLMKKLNIKRYDKVLLTVGRLEKPKGYQNLLKSVALLKKHYNNFILLIAGEGKDREIIEKQIETHSIKNNVKLLGQRDDVDQLLKISDLFVMSSLWEGLPIALLEAMASGSVIISTAVGGISEVIKNYDNGILIQPNSPKKMAETFLEVFKKDSLELIKMGKNAQKTIENYYQLKDKIFEYEKIYLSLR